MIKPSHTQISVNGKRYSPKPEPTRLKIPKVVAHPRYGDEVVSTGCKASAAEVHASYRQVPAVEIFTESAIRADIQRQNSEWTDPKYFYADILRRCLKCRRRFIFFAREQQFWYEELKINVATTAKYCCECASKNREVESALTRYEGISSPANLDDSALLQFVSDLVVLRKAEVLRNDERLKRAKNLLTKRKIPPEKWTDLRKMLAS